MWKKVYFGRTIHCLPQRLKSTFFEIFPSGGYPRRRPGVKKKFQKTLILVFEVIVQPVKTHFLTFSKVQKQKKSETKIMKITHSEKVTFLRKVFMKVKK